jgi:murein L,D-transpeptidase YcbB/YkuD
MIRRPVEVVLLICWGVCIQVFADNTGMSPAYADRFAVQLEQRLTLGPLPMTDVPLDIAVLRKFYYSRNYRPVWDAPTGQHTLMQRWLSVMDHIEHEGLDDLALHGEQIRRQTVTEDSADPVTLELLLTDSFFRYTNILARGQLDPLQLSPGWLIPTTQVDPAAILEQARHDGGFEAVLRNLRGDEYIRLSNQLERYSHIRDTGGWPSMDAVGQQLEEGLQHPEISMLDKLLRITGDLRDDRGPAEHRYDEVLQKAVRRFQRRHGLRVDGIVGTRTRAQLAIPVEDRIDQIRANLERLRWLPEDLGERYILVNTAAYELEVHETGSVSLRMKVVVGTKERQTPVFAGRLSHLVVNPYWNIPRKIALEDVIPQQLEDSGYFRHKGIRILSGWQPDAVELDPDRIDWQSYLDGEFLAYRLRQDPGRNNSLGRIKFMLPNRFSVYLHDTPAVHLFDQPERAYSSGCVRLERPLALASWLMRDNDEPVIIEELVDQDETLQMDLPEPVPVYLLYRTAWVDDKGHTQFRPDVYGRDAPIVEALPGQVPTASKVQIANNPSAGDDASL